MSGDQAWEDPNWDDGLYMTDPTSKSISGVSEALAIFARYVDGGAAKRFFCGAEHDELFIYVSPHKLGPLSVDGARLRCLGFHPNAEADCWSYFT